MLLSGCAGLDGSAGGTPRPGQDSPNLTDSQEGIEVEMSRGFYLGITPSPKTEPKTSFDDILDAYQEASELGEVVMVWTNPSGIGLHGSLEKSRTIEGVRAYGLMPVVSLTFYRFEKVQGEGLKIVIDYENQSGEGLSDQRFREAWIREAKMIAADFEPEYLALGNEANSYLSKNPDEVDEFESLLQEAYSNVKEESPGTKVMTVLAYNQIVENDDYGLIARLDDEVDIIGLTTYPWQRFDSPEDMPDDYYSRIRNYTKKPLAFTEIGWASESEDEQAEFIHRFIELNQGNNLEMANWLFLHEMQVTGSMEGIARDETGTIALKYANGTKKEAYHAWDKIGNLEYKKHT
jgi:hypothetical protein